MGEMAGKSSQILIDIGSSSVKCYRFDGQKLELFLTKSIPLKDGFDPEVGLSLDNTRQLFSLINQIHQQNKDTPIHIYGTAIFRKMSPQVLEKFSYDLNILAGLKLEVLSQQQENEFLELALMGKYQTPEPVLLINIGGGSTELVVVQKGEVVERVNIDLGVGSILTEFPLINNALSGVSMEVVKNFISHHVHFVKFNSRHPRPDRGSRDSRLRGNDDERSIRVAFYTGGELNYMRLVGYALQANILFSDPDHPSVISLTDFHQRNQQIFQEVTLDQLEALMPDNPKWMHGARVCSAFAEAICEKFGVEIIIPSDSNLMHGIVRKQFQS